MITLKKFREINSLVTSLVKTLIWRKKCWFFRKNHDHCANYKHIFLIFFCTSISQFFFLDLGLTLLETFLRIFSHHSLCTHVWPCNLMKRLNVWKKNISNRNRWMLKWRPMMLRMEKLTKVLINDSSKSYLHLKGQSGKSIFF